MLVATEAKDALLNYIKMNTTELHICSQEPADYNEASLVYSLGVKNAPGFTGPQGDPRSITINGFSDGLATATGVGTYWALVSLGLLLTTNSLLEGINIVPGFAFAFPDFYIMTLVSGSI